MWTQLLEEESGWGLAERGGHCCLPRGADCYADMGAEIVDHWEIEKKIFPPQCDNPGDDARTAGGSGNQVRDKLFVIVIVLWPQEHALLSHHY